MILFMVRENTESLLEKTTIGCVVCGAIISFGLIVYTSYLGIRALNKYLNQPEEIRENVIRGREKEYFIEQNGKLFYNEIDEIPVEEQLRN